MDDLHGMIAKELKGEATGELDDVQLRLSIVSGVEGGVSFLHVRSSRPALASGPDGPEKLGIARPVFFGVSAMPHRKQKAPNIHWA